MESAASRRNHSPELGRAAAWPGWDGGGQISHVGAILVSQGGRVLDSDCRGKALLRSGDVLRLSAGCLHASNASLQARLTDALRRTSMGGNTNHVLLWAVNASDRRYAVTMMPARDGGLGRKPERMDGMAAILCLAAPLDRRRMATVRQLMDLFGLTAAEARLARALANGDSVEEYAQGHELRLPTVRSQLSAVFHKTATERQASLVRLITAIPAVRDPF